MQHIPKYFADTYKYRYYQALENQKQPVGVLIDVLVWKLGVSEF